MDRQITSNERNLDFHETIRHGRRPFHSLLTTPKNTTEQVIH